MHFDNIVVALMEEMFSLANDGDFFALKHLIYYASSHSNCFLFAGKKIN